MTGYYIGYEDANTREWADNISEARIRAVKMLKTAPSKKEVLIENMREGIVVGRVLLNYEGIGVWKVGRTAWLISKNGNRDGKQPYG